MIPFIILYLSLNQKDRDLKESQRVIQQVLASTKE